MSELLVSSLYFEDGDLPNEKFGRSFYDKNLGFGKLETVAGDLRFDLARIHLFDLDPSRTVVLGTQLSRDPVGLVDDVMAPGIVEDALAHSLLHASPKEMPPHALRTYK